MLLLLLLAAFVGFVSNPCLANMWRRKLKTDANVPLHTEHTTLFLLAVCVCMLCVLESTISDGPALVSVCVDIDGLTCGLECVCVCVDVDGLARGLVCVSCVCGSTTSSSDFGYRVGVDDDDDVDVDDDDGQSSSSLSSITISSDESCGNTVHIRHFFRLRIRGGVVSTTATVPPAADTPATSTGDC